jgi:hypothetical protein
MCPGDVLQLPEALDARDPLAQVGGSAHTCEFLCVFKARSVVDVNIKVE